MQWILDQFFGRRIAKQTARYLDGVARAPSHTARKVETRLINMLNEGKGATVQFGSTASGQTIALPVAEILSSHGLITGGTGSGKTRAALLIVRALLDAFPHTRTAGFGVLDPKGELFGGTLALLAERLKALDAAAARQLRQRVVIIDFSSRDPVSPYNLLARSPNTDLEFFAGNRSDLVLDLLPGGDGVSIAASAVLRKAILLLADRSLPITALDDVLFNDAARARLVVQSSDRELAAYFMRQFPDMPKPTLGALSRRVDALFSAESVRLALSGTAVPDFRALQDEGGRIVLVNCFGANISRGVRHLLQSLVMTDVVHSVFARRRKETPFLWLCDEAQNFFATPRLREHMADLLTMARSFGSHALFLTQNIGTAVHDANALSVLTTNMRWAYCMRGEPGDCAFLRPLLPVTGRKLKPRTSPFEPPAFYSVNEERTMVFDGIAHLPDRTGYLWLRTRAAEAIRVTTNDLPLPEGREFEQAIASLRNDPTFGNRFSRKDYNRQIAERTRAWQKEPEADTATGFQEAYQRIRGDAS
jgi:hypothetical protein